MVAPVGLTPTGFCTAGTAIPVAPALSAAATFPFGAVSLELSVDVKTRWSTVINLTGWPGGPAPPCTIVGTCPGRYCPAAPVEGRSSPCSSGQLHICCLHMRSH